MGGSAAEAMAFATSAKRHPVKHRAVTMTGASQPVHMLTTLSTSALMSSVSFALLSQQVLWSLLHHLLFRVLPLFAGQSTRRAHTIRLADYLIKEPAKSSCFGKKVSLWAELGLAKDDKECSLIDVSGSDADNRPVDGLDERAERLDHAKVSDIVDTENEIGHGRDPCGLAIQEIEADASNASAKLILHAKVRDLSDIEKEIRHGMVHCGPAINEFEVDDPCPRIAESSESALVSSEVQHSATVAATAVCRRSVAPASTINTSDPTDSDEDGSGQAENSDDEYEWDADTNPIERRAEFALAERACAASAAASVPPDAALTAREPEDGELCAESREPVAPEGFWDRLRYQVYLDFFSAGLDDLVKLHDGQMQGHCLLNIASTHERSAAATPLRRDSRRDIILHCLKDALHTASGRLASDGLADEIERHLFLSWTGDEYLVQSRVITFQLRDPRNVALRQRLREDSVSAAEIISFCKSVRPAFLSEA